MTHICVNKLTTIGSDNGLAPTRRQTIIWTNAGILLIGHLWTNLSEILNEICIFIFKKKHLKMLFGKCRPFCLGPNVLKHSLGEVQCIATLQLPLPSTDSYSYRDTTLQAAERKSYFPLKPYISLIWPHSSQCDLHWYVCCGPTCQEVYTVPLPDHVCTYLTGFHQ